MRTFVRKLKGSLSLWVSLNVLVMFICMLSLVRHDDLSFGRKPWRNLQDTFKELSRPSFLKIWTGSENFEYKNDEGVVLRTENQKELEEKFLFSLMRAGWMSFKVATVGSALAALLGFFLCLLASKKLNFSFLLRTLSVLTINFFRSIHTLVFGLFLVGIVGLGPMAGILAIALHSMGSYGKLFAEAIDSHDFHAADALKISGAGRVQVFIHGVLPGLTSQFFSLHLYVWEFNLRDSAVLGLVGAGGIGLLLSDAVSLFAWQRLATLILFLFFMVSSFNYLSAKIREAFV